MSGDSHPARKVNKDELKSLLKKRNEEVPALTTRAIAMEFPEVKSQSVGNNLDDLADAGEIRRFSDGDIRVWWYPRPGEEGGTIRHSELVDDSIDWDEVDANMVPREIAEEIVSERLPHYYERTFWNRAIHACQLGIMASFGLVILGIGGLVGGTLGIGQEAGAQVFGAGLYLSLFAMIGYIASIILDNLAKKGHVTKNPIGDFKSRDWNFL